MKFTNTAAALLTISTIASASPLVHHAGNLDEVSSSISKRGMNMDLFQYTKSDPKEIDMFAEREAALTQAQKEAIQLASAAIDELNSDSDRLLKLYFTTKNKDDAKARIKAVYERITGGGQAGADSTGGPLVSKLRPVPQTTAQAQCARNLHLLVTTTPTTMKINGQDIAPIQICPRFWTLQSLQASLAACRTLPRPEQMDGDWLNMAGVLVHEYTHFNEIGRGKTGLKDIIDSDAAKSNPYGLEASKDFVHPLRSHIPGPLGQESRAEFNADNYNWFALHAYMERNCGKNGQRIKLK